MKKINKKMLMYWIASHHNCFKLLSDNLNIEYLKLYNRLYRNQGKLDDLNMRIAEEINNITKKDIDLVTMLKLFTEDEAKKFIT